MTGITNKDLEILCKKFFDKTFLGVYPSDTSLKFKPYYSAVIFNLSAHNEKGTHFIAIIKKLNKIIYFDSFGEKCTNKNILKFIDQYFLPIEYNSTKIQDDTSSLCGYFCFYFLFICFFKSKSLKHFLKKFKTKNLKTNDKKLLNCIVKLIKT